MNKYNMNVYLEINKFKLNSYIKVLYTKFIVRYKNKRSPNKTH